MGFQELLQIPGKEAVKTERKSFLPQNRFVLIFLMYKLFYLSNVISEGNFSKMDSRSIAASTIVSVYKFGRYWNENSEDINFPQNARTKWYISIVFGRSIKTVYMVKGATSGNRFM